MPAGSIAVGTITGAGVAVGTITGAGVAVGTITGGGVAVGTITGAGVAVGTITGVASLHPQYCESCTKPTPQILHEVADPSETVSHGHGMQLLEDGS